MELKLDDPRILPEFTVEILAAPEPPILAEDISLQAPYPLLLSALKIQLKLQLRPLLPVQLYPLLLHTIFHHLQGGFGKPFMIPTFLMLKFMSAAGSTDMRRPHKYQQSPRSSNFCLTMYYCEITRAHYSTSSCSSKVKRGNGTRNSTKQNHSLELVPRFQHSQVIGLK